jgi:type III secretion protein W
MQDDFSTSPIEPTDSSRIQRQEQLQAKRETRFQMISKAAMTEYAEEAAFNPVTMSRRYQTLEEKRRKEGAKKEAEKAGEKILAVEEISNLSEEYERNNPELRARSLERLLAQIKGEKDPEELLRQVMKNYPDHSLADESLEFLEKATTGDVRGKVRAAKENLNANYGREVRAGRNIANESRAFSQQGLGSPTALRDLYRDITGQPRPATALFNELHEMFTYENMQKAIDFILHSLGSDLKSKGPSISPGELHSLMSEARSLLAILGVYRFFDGRMALIASSFERNGMLLPSYLSFQLLAKMFVQFLLERYPSMDKVLQLALKMGISADLLAQIILFTQMRDAVRGVAPKLFRSQQHRYDVLMSFIEALEELEEQVEEEDDDEEEDEEEE